MIPETKKNEWKDERKNTPQYLCSNVVIATCISEYTAKPILK